jgi:hypothetical protein
MRTCRIVLGGIILVSLALSPCLGQDLSRHGTALRPLSEIINSDGTLRLEKGLAGSFDPRGYRMVAEAGQEPRFVRSARTAAGPQNGSGLLGADTGYWDGKFGISGVGGPVYHLAAGGSTLYAVGDFAGPPGMPLGTFAKWDGTSWSAFGSGLEVDVNNLAAVAASGETVYIAGAVWTGTNWDRFLQKWDGTAWSALPWDVDDYIYVLAAYNDILYVGGSFTAVGAVSARNVAKWDGTSWSQLKSGANSSVYALAVSGDVLYAGGNFTSAGGVANTRYIAQWDTITETWSALGTGMNSAVNNVEVGDGVLYAEGIFTTAGGVPAAYLAQWDGENWSALGTGLGGSYVQIDDIAVGGSILYVSGYFSIDGGTTMICLAQWNGSSWSGLGDGFLYNPPNNMATIGSTLYVGGYFESAGGVPAHYIAQWNGTWTDVDSAECGGADGSIDAMAVGGSNLYIAGYFSSIAGVPADGLAKWDGTSWSAIPLSWDEEEEDSEIEVLAVSKDGDTLYAGGEFLVIGGVIAYNVAKWDGANWSALFLGVLGEDASVWALAVGEDESGDDILYVGGEFTIAGGQFANNIAKFENGNWSKLGTGTDGGVYALALSGSTLYVGGYFSSAGGVENTQGIAQWDGSTWSALGSGLAGEYGTYVNTLAVSGSTLYVGGGFGSAGGVPYTNGIAQWNGSTWSALGSGLVGDEYGARVYTLAVSDSALYVGGAFVSAGGVALNNIAKWDGANWSALGTGMDEGYPSYLAVLGSDLYVGGSFREAGDVSSADIALWHFGSQPRVRVDFDQDGQEDILWRNYGSGAYQGLNVIWLMAQGGTPSPIPGKKDLTLAQGTSLLTGKTASVAFTAASMGGPRISAAPKEAIKSVAAVGKVPRLKPQFVMRDPLDVGRTAGPARRGDLRGRDLRLRNVQKRSEAVDASALKSGDVKIASYQMTTEIVFSQVADTDWQIVAVGDFDGDGDPDLLWRNLGTGPLSGLSLVWYMNGTQFDSEAFFSWVASTDWRIVGTGDFDGDGDLDILWRYFGTGPNQGLNIVWYLNGLSYVEAVWSQVTDLDWTIMGTGDFNGDGDPDILWRNTGTGPLQGLNIVWYMNGAQFGSEAVYSWVANLAWQIVGTGDYDGDGDMDILWRNYGTGPLQGVNVIWYMNGATFVSEEVFSIVADLTWRILNR